MENMLDVIVKFS